MSASYSDSDPSSHLRFRDKTRHRLLKEMFETARKKDSSLSLKVLILDNLTIKVMSHACKLSETREVDASVVEDMNRERRPFPTMDAVYFIQPSRENLIRFLSDMSGKTPLYKKAHMFFSSPVPPLALELVSRIRKDTTVRPRLGGLYEMNLEYLTIDSQGFITNNESALEDLFGDEENHRKGEACLQEMATRIATVFASMGELPFVRYRAARSLDANTMTTYRDLVPTKLAAGVWNCLTKYKSLGTFPQIETCELLILDRSVDQVAPVIHEWTYDAMCHDLLNIEGNKYVCEVPSRTGGPPEIREVLLEEHDPIWLELRDSHIADASEQLHEKMTNFLTKNKAAQVCHGSRNGELSTKDLQELVKDLPQYSEQVDKLSLHVEIAGKINQIVKEQGLKDLGQLEQDLVFGDAGTKDVIHFLTTKEDVSRENKLRLLMVYAAVLPEKFAGEKGSKLLKLAQLTADDMNAVNNMKLLQVPSETKERSRGAFSLKFDKKKHAARKDRADEVVVWQLSRFYPMIEVLIEKLSKGELCRSEYPCMNDPCPTFHGTTHAPSIQNFDGPIGQSVRTRRPTWAAHSHISDDGCSSSSLLRHASNNLKMGQRIYVFIIGGATRSELRSCHKLSVKLKREIILGSSSIDDPLRFIEKMKMLTTNELSLDDIQI